MFTGLVEKTGRLVHASSLRPSELACHQLLIFAPHFPCALGDSVAVNGCCLTVTSYSADGFLTFDVSKETLGRTNLASLQSDQLVNLERALELGARLGGHLVTGHIDETATIACFEPAPDGTKLLEIMIPSASAGLVVPKGSICIDGVSLTVNKLSDGPKESRLSFTLIPTTLAMTSFQSVPLGHRLNVEYDLLGKYILRQNQLAG